MEKNDSIVALPAGLVLGMVVSILLSSFDDLSIWVLVGMPVFALCILFLSRFGSPWAGPVWAALGVGVSFPMFVFARILIDTTIDPTDHNLWPLELLLACVYSAPPAIAGLLAGWHLRRGTD